MKEDIKSIIEKWSSKKGSLIMLLHEIQEKYGFISRESAFEIAKAMGIPVARIYEVLTFYHLFKLDPPARYNISVCKGTACYLRGADELIKEIENTLGIKEGETTKDGLFHLEGVRCLGCCGLAPVLMVNGKIYGKVKKEDIVDIISKCTKEDEDEQ